MWKQSNVSTLDVTLWTFLVHLGMLAMLVIGGAKIALSQPRPGGDPANPLSGTGSLPDDIFIYPAQGAPAGCGENCSDWLAAEGRVYWDGYKRIIAGLDRFANRKRPVFLNVRGQSDLGVAISVGRILRERGIEVGVGQTIADRCRELSEPDCLALKRSGASLHASLSSIGTCDLACVLILAGGVRRMLPEDTTVVIHSSQVFNRLGLNVSDEHRQGVHARFREQSKIYFAQMGLDPALADIIDANYGTARSTQLSRADVIRLRIVTAR
jgi:hypothetical protein